MNITLNENINKITNETYSVNTSVQNNVTDKNTDNLKDDTAAILELSTATTQEEGVTVKSVQSDAVAVSQTENFSTVATDATVSPMALGTTQIQECQNWLRTLGLYSGSPDGNAGGEELVEGVEVFQRVYGLTVNGTINAVTYAKIKNVYTAYTEMYNGEAMETLEKSLYLDEHAKKNFAHVWAFLKCGMSLTNAQIAGVMGNIHKESAFSSDNAQDDVGYPGEHNSADYGYSISDEVGYGLLQWTSENRKLGLRYMAGKMNRQISDVFVQLAYFREEITGDYADTWAAIKNTYIYGEVSDIFLREFESPKNPNYEERRAIAKIIYEQIKEM